ncbi:MAG: hypothetical protein HY049_07065 [Acidobacteria bacterium]|nr:hypothetical protein [Acidobacteriota bacterium]
MSSKGQRAGLAGAFLLLTAALCFTPISNNDIWLHLRTGSLILERGAVPRVEEYTYTRAGEAIVDHEWLSQIVFASAHAIAGLDGLTLLKALLFAATLAIVYRASIESAGAGAGAAAAAALATLGAALLVASHLFIRPHLFTLLFAAVFAWILPRLAAAPTDLERWLWIASLAALQLLWANLHGGFVVGILLAGTFAAGDMVASRRARAPWLALPPLLAAASLVNPYGARIYALAASFGDPIFRELILEWKSPFADPFVLTPLFWIYALWLAATLAAAVWALRRRDFACALTAVAFAALSITSRRHVSLLGVVTAPLLARAGAALAARIGGRVLPAWRAWIAVALVAATALFTATVGVPWERAEWRRPGRGIGENIPVEALRFARDAGLTGRVMTSLSFGTYVTWAAWPSLATSIDSRLEVFGGPFLRAYRAGFETAEAFRDLEGRYPADLALLAWQSESVSGAVGFLSADPAWALVYFDDVAVLYVKRAPATEGLVGRAAYRVIDPARFLSTAGTAALGTPPEIEAEARRAVGAPESLPGRPAMNSVARTILGSALRNQRRFAEAAAELRLAVAARPRNSVAWGLLGLSLAESGDRAGAREAFLELRRLVPGSTFAQRMIDELGAQGR